MPDSAVKILRGASFLVFDTSVSALVGILAFALISRLITMTEMGIMTVLLMVTSTCQLISTMGLSSASTKFIAEAMGQGDVKTASAVASKVLKVALATSSVMALMCFVFSEDLSRLLLGTPQHQILFQVLAANIFFSGLLPLLTGILLGLKQLRSLAVFGLISFSLQQGLVVLLLFLHMGLFGVVLGWAVANMFNCVVFIWSISQSLALSAAKKFHLRALLGYSWPLYAVAFVSLLDNWFDRVLLLGYPLGELGAYNVAFKAFGYLYAIPIVISDGFFPHLSELRSRDGPAKLSSTLTLASRYLALVATPLALGLAATANPVISLFAGRTYAYAGLPLAILCVAAAISVFGLVLGKILLVMDETLPYALIVLSTVLTGLGLGEVLVPMLGLMGASLARATAMILGLLFLIGVTSRKISLKMDFQALWKSWTAGLLMVGAIIPIQTVYRSSVMIPVYVVLGMLVYTAILRELRAVRNEDIELLKSFLGPKIGAPVARWLRAALIP